MFGQRRAELGIGPAAKERVGGIEDGKQDAGNDGGGINNLEESDLTLEDTKVKRNRADNGGGVFSEGSLSAIASQIVNNNPNNCVHTGGGGGGSGC